MALRSTTFLAAGFFVITVGDEVALTVGGAVVTGAVATGAWSTGANTSVGGAVFGAIEAFVIGGLIGAAVAVGATVGGTVAGGKVAGGTVAGDTLTGGGALIVLTVGFGKPIVGGTVWNTMVGFGKPIVGGTVWYTMVGLKVPTVIGGGNNGKAWALAVDSELTTATNELAASAPAMARAKRIRALCSCMGKLTRDEMRFRGDFMRSAWRKARWSA